MLKAMFDIFETTEVQLTHSAVMRLRWASVMGFPALPIFAAIEYFEPTGALITVAFIAGIISVLSLVYCASTRLANRLWVPEKYLDEVEIERKRRSASLTYQILVLLFAAVATVFLFVFPASQVSNSVSFTPRALTFLFGALLCCTCALQTGIAAWMTEPLTEGRPVRTPTDGWYKWGVGGFFLATFVLIVVLKRLF